MPIEFSMINLNSDSPTLLITLFTTLVTTSVAVFVAILGWYFGNRTAMKQVDKTFMKRLQIEASRDVIKALRGLIKEIQPQYDYLVRAEHGIACELGKEEFRPESDREKLAVDYYKIITNMRKMHNSFRNKFLDLIVLYEDNEVVLNQFKKYHNDMRNYYYRSEHLIKDYEMCLKNFSAGTKYDPNKGVFEKEKVAENQFNQYKACSKELTQLLYNMIFYSNNYITQLQNAYQSDIFQYKIPERKPYDIDRHIDDIFPPTTP